MRAFPDASACENADTDSGSDGDKQDMLKAVRHTPPLLAEDIAGPVTANGDGESEAILEHRLQRDPVVSPEVGGPGFARARIENARDNDTGSVDRVILDSRGDLFDGGYGVVRGRYFAPMGESGLAVHDRRGSLGPTEIHRKHAPQALH